MKSWNIIYQEHLTTSNLRNGSKHIKVNQSLSSMKFRSWWPRFWKIVLSQQLRENKTFSKPFESDMIVYVLFVKSCTLTCKREVAVCVNKLSMSTKSKE